jgi:hypothetical protein
MSGESRQSAGRSEMSYQPKHILIDPLKGFLLETPEDASGTGSVFVKWNDVFEIQTYKLDLFAYDMIVLGFYELHKDRFTEVWEDAAGWSDLCEIITKIFPGFPEGWWSEVAYPPFETNMRTLYKRSSEST